MCCNNVRQHQVFYTQNPRNTKCRLCPQILEGLSTVSKSDPPIDSGEHMGPSYAIPNPCRTSCLPNPPCYPPPPPPSVRPALDVVLSFHGFGDPVRSEVDFAWVFQGVLTSKRDDAVAVLTKNKHEDPWRPKAFCHDGLKEILII